MNLSSAHITQSLQLAWWKAAATAAEQAVSHRRYLVAAVRVGGLALLAATAYSAGVLVGQLLNGLRF
jgi:hypothetical protein